MSYAIHPAADFFPMMTDEDLQELVADIKTNGLREPIKLFEGQILDGRNRYRACELAEVEPRFETISDDHDPYDYVYSWNALRRHLDAGQRAVIKALLLEASAAWRRLKQGKASAALQPRNAHGHFERIVSHNTIGPFFVYRSPKRLGIHEEYGYIGASADLERRAQEHGVDVTDLQILHTCDSIEEAGRLERLEKEARGLSTQCDGGPSGHNGLGRDWSEDYRTVGIPGSTREMLAKLSGTSSTTSERAMTLIDRRPDLAEEVKTGKCSLNAAVKQMKRETPKTIVTPTQPRPSSLRLYVALAEALPLHDSCVDIIITSPPYNIGPKGGRPEQRQSGQSTTGGRAWAGIEEETRLPEAQYQRWQLAVLKELFRVAKPGASLFYNHKIRQRDGAMIHPMQWLLQVEGWTLRQEIIWNRGSTHNHEPSYFWPHDERVYWMTKGKPRIHKEGIQQSTIWDFHGPVSDTWHVSPFPEELPKRCLAATSAEGKVVLDPFGGSMTVCKVALDMGAAQAIGCDKNQAHIERATLEYGWKEDQ